MALTGRGGSTPLSRIVKPPADARGFYVLGLGIHRCFAELTRGRQRALLDVGSLSNDGFLAPMIRRWTTSLLLLASGTLLAIAAAANAAVTVGPDVHSTPLAGSACSAASGQETLINSGPIGVSPISGVVVRFRVAAFANGANGLAPELRIIQNVGGGYYAGAGSGGPAG